MDYCLALCEEYSTSTNKELNQQYRVSSYIQPPFELEVNDINVKSEDDPEEDLIHHPVPLFYLTVHY